MFAVLCSAVSIHAIQLQWGAGTGAAGRIYDGNVLMNNANGYTVTSYLIYLGDDATGWGDFNPAQTPITYAGKVGVPESGVHLPSLSGSNINVDSYNDGKATFGVLYIATIDGVGNTFFDGTTGAHFYMTDIFVYDTTDANRWTAGTTTFAFTEGIPTGTSSAWTPVPEPATAALALAGLALLIRRRK